MCGASSDALPSPWLADWVVGDSSAPNYFASTLETISSDDQLGLVEPRIHLTAVKSDPKDGPDLHAIFVKARNPLRAASTGVQPVCKECDTWPQQHSNRSTPCVNARPLLTPFRALLLPPRGQEAHDADADSVV